ncbi:MAG: hypothetical protein H7Y00_01115 [Fimbriimonadaceae bacterium]|nr:hypothetical protein [Chitinophagales bacterium]
MKNFFGHFISIVFQPLFLPLYGTLYIIYSNPYMFPDKFENYQNILRIALNTFFFPAVIVLLLYKLKFVKGVNLKNRQDRIIPYVAAMMCYIWTFYVYYHEQLNPTITFILLGSCISIFLAFMINTLVMKVSMHTTGGGGLVAMMLILIPFSYFNPLLIFIISILVAGAIGSARLALHAHTTREVYYGYLIGFFSFMIATNLYPL